MDNHYRLEDLVACLNKVLTLMSLYMLDAPPPNQWILFLAKIQALKKSISKGDKKRKKEVSVEIAKLEQEIQEKQQSDFNSEVTETFNNGSDVIGISEQFSNTDLGLDDHQRKSKAQKRKVGNKRWID